MAVNKKTQSPSNVNHFPPESPSLMDMQQTLRQGSGLRIGQPLALPFPDMGSRAFGRLPVALSDRTPPTYPCEVVGAGLVFTLL